MIGLDTSTKMKKSPNKPSVQIPIVKEYDESDSENFEDSDAEEAGTDSPNEEIDVDKNDKLSSGAEGDESDANDDGEQSNDVTDKSKANPGWADAMKKILSTTKPKKKKTIVLSKAKKLQEILSKPKEVVLPFEVESKDGKIKKETIKIKESVIDNEKTVEHKKRKRKESLGIRIKPSILDREREKRFQKIATNGVVQLFNAVTQQQKEIEEKLVEAGPLERKRDKVLKNIDRKAFLDVLMGGTNKLAPDNRSQEEKEERDEVNTDNKNEKLWSVLKDDFVMGAKLKDWNKCNTTDEESSAPEEMDSD